MASTSRSAKLMEEIYDQFLVCKICFEFYKSPKTLVCLHTFCLDCLEKHMDAEIERSYRYMLYSRAISCPICRKKTEIPTGGIRRLPDNFLVSNLSDVIERRKPTSKGPHCEICNPSSPGSSSNEAVSKCLECGKLLCCACVELHRRTKVTQSHNIFDIEVQKDIECKVHPEESVRFYCEPCEVCICVVCTFQEHKGHEVSSFSDGIQKYSRTLNSLLLRCRDRIGQLKDQLDVINKCENSLKQTEEHIRDVAIDSISAIRKREKEMLKDLHCVFGRDAMELMKDKEPIQEDLDSLQSTYNLTDIILKDKSVELLLLKREIQEKVALLLQRKLQSYPESVLQEVKFVPGNMMLGYLQLDGEGPPAHDMELRNSSLIRTFSPPGKCVENSHDDHKVKRILQQEDATSMGNFMREYCAVVETQTDRLPTKESSTSPIHVFRAHATTTSCTMTTPNVRDRQTMCSITTPTMKRKVQTDQVCGTDQQTNTMSKICITSNKGINTQELLTVERSTLTLQKSYCDQNTATFGLLQTKEQDTCTSSVILENASTVTDTIFFDNKATLTNKPFSSDKITSTPKVILTTQETNTPYVPKLDFAVTAKMYGDEKATSTKVIVLSENGVGDGDVRMTDECVNTPWGSATKVTSDKDIMCKVDTNDMFSETDTCALFEKGTFTHFFNMLDKTIETDILESCTVSTFTDMIQHIDMFTSTDRIELVDKDVSAILFEPVVKPECRDWLCQTDISFRDRMLYPNPVPCDQFTNTPTIKYHEKGIGVAPSTQDIGISTPVLTTGDICINSMQASPSVNVHDRETSTMFLEVQDCATVTDAVSTRENSNDAFRGVLMDVDTNTEPEETIHPWLAISDMTVSLDKGVGASVPVTERSMETMTLNVHTIASNTERVPHVDGITSMDSMVSTCNMATATDLPGVATRASSTVSIATNDVGIATVASQMADHTTETEKTHVEAKCVGTPNVAIKDTATETAKVKLMDTGVNPQALDVTHSGTCMPLVEFSSTAVGTPVILSKNKGISTLITETKEDSTNTFVQTVEKATYMPQTVTISRGVATVGPLTAEKLVNTERLMRSDSGTMTPPRKTAHKNTTMRSMVGSADISTNTNIVNLTDTGVDPEIKVLLNTSTNTRHIEMCDIEAATTEVITSTLGTTTHHAVTSADQSTDMPRVITQDMATNVERKPLTNKQTMTHIETRNVGLLKRPHAVSRGSCTPRINTADGSTAMEQPFTAEVATGTMPRTTAEKQVLVKPFGLIHVGTTTTRVDSTEQATEMPVVDYINRGSSPVNAQLVERQSSPILWHLVDRQTSPVSFLTEDKGTSAKPATVEIFTSTVQVTVQDTSTNMPRVVMVNRDCSPVRKLFHKDLTTRSTSTLALSTQDRQLSPFRGILAESATNTQQTQYTDRASTPIHIPGEDKAIMVRPATETKQVCTLQTPTKDSATVTPHVRLSNSSTSMPQVSFIEKETCTPFVHLLHKNVSTDNMAMVDKQTNTSDVAAVYRDLIAKAAPTVNAGTCTPALTMVERDTSPPHPFMVDKASSPVRVLMVHRAVSASKGEIMEPVDTFEKAGSGKASLKPVADNARPKLESIREDSKESSEDEGGDTCSLLKPMWTCKPPKLTKTVDRALSPMFPLASPPKSPRSPTFRPSLREALSTGGMTHREKFWPSAPNLSCGKRSESTFAFPGRSTPSSILMKVEMATNTTGITQATKQTSTPPVEVEDKASCTETVTVETKMAECINKLKTVRQRLEQKQSGTPSRTLEPPKPHSAPESSVPPSPNLRALHPVRSKSVGDSLNDADFPPFIPPLLTRKSSGSDMTSSTDSAQESSDQTPPSPSCRPRQALARKQRLNISELLRTESLPEQDHTPVSSPVPKPKIHHTQVIPKLNIDDYKRKPRESRRHKQIKSSSSGEERSSSGSPSQRRRHINASDSLKTKMEKQKVKLAFGERRTLTKQLIHEDVKCTRADAILPAGRSSQKQRASKPLPKLHVTSEEDE